MIDDLIIIKMREYWQKKKELCEIRQQLIELLERKLNDVKNDEE